MAFNFILIRGLARESAHWGSFAELLESQSYCKKVYALDLPGTGVYHNVSSPITIKKNAEFLVSKIKKNREKDERYIILSVSLGSMVAIEMVQRYPELFIQAYLMNTSISGLSPFYERLQMRTLKRFYRILKSSDVDKREREVLKMVSNCKDHWDQTVVEWSKIAQLRPVLARNFFRQLLAASYYRIPKVKPLVPLVIFCSKDDNMVHSKCSEALARYWKIPIFFNRGAGHELSLDDPDWVIQRLKENIFSS